MSAMENTERARTAYKAFSAGDVEAAMQDLDDEVEWIVPGDSAVSGTYRGKEEVLGFWMKLAEKGFTTEPEHFVADDERVVVLTQVTTAGESSDQADVITFRNDKVVRFQSAGDTAMLERIFGSR